MSLICKKKLTFKWYLKDLRLDCTWSKEAEIESDDETCFSGDSFVEVSSYGGAGKERIESEEDGKDITSEVDGNDWTVLGETDGVALSCEERTIWWNQSRSIASIMLREWLLSVIERDRDIGFLGYQRLIKHLIVKAKAKDGKGGGDWNEKEAKTGWDTTLDKEARKGRMWMWSTTHWFWGRGT